MNLNDAVAAAVAGWREYRDVLHDADSGTYNEQPTIVKALIEAVTIRCFDDRHGFLDRHYQPSLRPSNPCCHGTGRVPRDWEEIGEGALSGRIQAVALGFNDGGWMYDRIVEATRWPQMNPDAAALDAVDKALAQMFEVANA